MRILGLDLGTKTLGVSVSDNTEIIATGLTTLRFEENKPEDVINDLEEIIEEYNAKKIVIGLPKNMDNTLGFAADRTFKFIKVLKENFNIEIVTQDERLSSVTANNVLLNADLSRKKRKEKVDKLAATIILQNYLDIRKGIKNGK
ncbi:MAG: Holliday junction resolvase RuvX [Bacilli bacterium]|nr:Holliday junction resolvase RuvX [Bacilli bacterium]